ncbi:unnamed protein product [Alopecurus aequalis]
MAMAQRALGGLLRRSLGLTPPTPQRALSASAAPAASAPAAAEGEAAKAKRAKKKNLFDVVQFLPDWGVGYKVAKTTWRDVSYQITKINLYKDGRHGKAWGIRHKAAWLPLPGWSQTKTVRKHNEEACLQQLAGCASGRDPDKDQRSEQTWLEVHKGVSEEDGARYPQITNASRGLGTERFSFRLDI